MKVQYKLVYQMALRIELSTFDINVNTVKPV